MDLQQLIQTAQAQEILIAIECDACGEVGYYELGSLPGGVAECEYCSNCGEMLPSTHAAYRY